MLKFTAFSTKKPRQFEYKPRFYDPEKEAREKRKRELLGPEAIDIEGEYEPGQYIKRQRLYREAQPPRKSNNEKITRIIRFTVMGILAAIVIAFLLKL